MNDPGNVGTLVRVADWFGMAGVVLSTDSAARRPFKVPWGLHFTPHSDSKLHGLAIPMEGPGGLDAGGQNLFELPEQEAPTMLVVGSESHGVSQDVSNACHLMASIPGAGRAESLNASVAGAIAAASLVQQGVSVGQGR